MEKLVSWHRNLFFRQVDVKTETMVRILIMSYMYHQHYGVCDRAVREIFLYGYDHLSSLPKF